MDIWTISSQCFKIFGLIPLTSLPAIRAIFLFLDGLYEKIFLLLFVCSSAKIVKPSFFNFFKSRHVCDWYSHGIHFSAPKAVFDIFSCGGVGVIPQR